MDLRINHDMTKPVKMAKVVESDSLLAAFTYIDGRSMYLQPAP